jgi:hypothetical protein
MVSKHLAETLGMEVLLQDMFEQQHHEMDQSM